MLKTLTVGGRTVEYELIRKKVKNVNIRVRADMSIQVSAPRSTSTGEIEKIVLAKADFIFASLKRISEKKQNIPAPRIYEDGETINIFGETKKLKIERGKQNTAKICGGKLILTLQNPDDAELRKKTLRNALDGYAQEYITQLCHRVYPSFAKHNIAFPVLKFRYMTTMWGNCRAGRGVLTFNTALAEAPKECVEYVVYHEFCHFLHPNHSKDFYTCLEAFVPDRKRLKKLLNDSVRLDKS